jgi:Holliday junction resolvasome RuvABC endonuclease subunit
MSDSPAAPRIYTIDMALEKSGMSYFDDALERPVTWTFDTGKLRGHERENAIKAEIDRTFEAWAPEVVLLEKLPPRITPGLIGLAFLHGVIRNHLDGLAPYVEVPVSHVKIYATGKGAGAEAGKTQVLLSVDRRYPQLVTVGDDNQADAFTLLALGRHAYGYPLPTVDGRKLPNTHLRVLDMLVDWPAIGIHKPPVGATATTSRRSGRAKTKRESA